MPHIASAGWANVRIDEHDLDRVSFHAVTRYVQRIVGVFVADVDEAPSPLDCARAHCEAAGTSIYVVRQAVMTPALLVACRMGPIEVAMAGFRACISKEGIVTTILRPRSLSTKKILFESGSEMHRHRRQFYLSHRSRISA